MATKPSLIIQSDSQEINQSQRVWSLYKGLLKARKHHLVRRASRMNNSSKLSKSGQKNRRLSSSSGQREAEPSSSPRERSDDSQPTPAQRLQPSQVLEDLPKVTKLMVQDELATVERQVIALSILYEKRDKLQGMVAGSRDIPAELKAKRSLPGLGPQYTFSAKARSDIVDWVVKQDKKYVEVLCKDLVNNVIPDASSDLDDLKATARKRLSRKLDEEEFNTAVKVFDQECEQLVEKGADLLKKSREKRPAKPEKRKAPAQQFKNSKKSHHGSKRRRFDDKENKSS